MDSTTTGSDWIFGIVVGTLVIMAGASWLGNLGAESSNNNEVDEDNKNSSVDETNGNGSNSNKASNSTLKNGKNKKNINLLYKRKKYRFMDRPSLLDTGMSMILPWRQDENESSKSLTKSVFRGWFNLLWLITLSFIGSQFYENYTKHGRLITNLQFFRSLYTHVHELLFIILPVYVFSFSAFILQKLMVYEIFGTKYTRSILHVIQHLLQSVLIFGVGGFVFFFCEHWPFSQKLALTMQSITFYMKMHSYLLSNEELYELKQETLSSNKTTKKQNKRKASKTKNVNKNIITSLTSDLHEMSDVNRLTNDEVMEELRTRGIRNLDTLPDKSNFFCCFVSMDDVSGSEDLKRQCLPSSRNIAPFEYPSTKAKISRMMSSEGLEISEAIDSLKKLEENEEKMDYYRMVLKDAIFMENYRCNVYPKNVTFWNFFEFTWMPTVVYEPLYPRTSGIRIFYLIEKGFTAILLIGVMYTLFEKYMMPVLIDTSLNSVEQVIKLLVPMTILDILGFFLVFDSILNFFAEVTCFADRQFYVCTDSVFFCLLCKDKRSKNNPKLKLCFAV